MVSKKVLLGIGIVAVFAVVLFTVKGFPPTDEGTEGAVGAAKRYQTEQISSDDVVLQDPEVQDLLQSDFFYKLVTDDAFRKVAIVQVQRLSDVAMGRAGYASLTDLNKVATYASDNKQFAEALNKGDYQAAKQLVESNRAVYGSLNKLQVASERMTYADLGRVSAYASDNKQFADALNKGDFQAAKQLVASDKQVAAALDRMQVASDRQAYADLGKVGAYASDNKAFVDALNKGDFQAAKQLVASDKQVAAALDRMQVASDRQAYADLGKVGAYASDNKAFVDALNKGDFQAAKQLVASDKQVAAALDRMQVASDKQAYADLGKVGAYASDNKAFVEALNKGDFQAAKQIASSDKAIVNALDKMQVASDKQAYADLGKVSVQDLSVTKAFVQALNKGDFQAAKQIASSDKAGGTPLEYIIITRNRQACADLGKVSAYASDNKAFVDGLNKGDFQVAKQIASSDRAIVNALDKMQVASERMTYTDLGKVSAYASDNKAFADALNKMDFASAKQIASSDRAIVNALDKMQIASERINYADLNRVNSFASDNKAFADALNKGQIPAAEKIAVASGRSDISSDRLQVAAFVVGDSKGFVADLGRLTSIADSPSFRATVDSEGFGKLIAQEGDWKQAVQDVQDGKFHSASDR